MNIFRLPIDRVCVIMAAKCQEFKNTLKTYIYIFKIFFVKFHQIQWPNIIFMGVKIVENVTVSKKNLFIFLSKIIVRKAGGKSMLTFSN